MPSKFGKSGSTAGRAKAGRKSIRGTISSPIPIPITLDDDEFPFRNPGSARASIKADDEFPIRRPGTGIASSLPLADDSEPSPEGQPGQSGKPEHGLQIEGEGKQEQGAASISAQTSSSTSAGNPGGSPTDLPGVISPGPPTNPGTSVGGSDSRPQSRSPLSRLSPPRKNSPSRGSPPASRATNPVLSTIRYSLMSESPGKQTDQSKDLPQRKKSTLRSALGRLFGRGRKKNANGGDSSPAGSLVQHRSDPIALSRPTQQISPKRSASGPLNEYDRPLRSHSIGPDDLMAIESARNSVHLDAAVALAGGRRRAVTTGGPTLLSPHMRTQGWGGVGLSPRPASAHGRASRLAGQAETETESPDDIGRAITSDSSTGARRRSRSLSGLQDHAGVQPCSRRRSDEIRHWRASYDPAFISPLAFNAQEDIDDPGMAEAATPESPVVERPPKTPAQPFNFGSLSKKMVGMNITQAANMDTRLVGLESRTLQLERVVERMSNLIPSLNGAVDAENTAWPGSSQRLMEPESHGEVLTETSPTCTGPPQPPSSSATNTQSLITAAEVPGPPRSRPTSNSTVRAASSMPIMGRETGHGIDARHADAIAQLQNDLDAERAARQALEAQVKRLSEHVNALSTTMFALMRGPSESRSQERLAASLAASSSLPGPLRTLGLAPATVFETDEEDDPGLRAQSSSGGVPSSSWGVPSSLATTTSLDEEDMTEDDFETPREESAPSIMCGALGEELGPDDGDGLGEDDPKREKTVRTLSLGRLTLRTGPRPEV